MEPLVEAAAALWCEKREDGNSSPPWAHDKISSLTLFAKVEYGAQNYSLLFLLTVFSICVAGPEMKHSGLYPQRARCTV